MKFNTIKLALGLVAGATLAMPMVASAAIGIANVAPATKPKASLIVLNFIFISKTKKDRKSVV